MTYTHQSQYDPGSDLITRRAGCTWTSLANGIRATTAEAHKPTPDEIHDLVSRNEETAPTTPGWSLTDAALAAGRYGMALVDHTGEGWEAVVAAHNSRHYILLQGDSDQFGNATCSGDFDGLHCAGIHPKTKVEGTVTYWWIDDPICPEGRWERVSVLKAYASKLWTRIRFAAFLQPVPAAGWEVSIPAGSRFATFDVTGKLITGTHIQATPGGIDRPCSAPAEYHFSSGATRMLVKIGGDGPNAGVLVRKRWAHPA